jgi:hypothetical protein
MPAATAFKQALEILGSPAANPRNPAFPKVTVDSRLACAGNLGDAPGQSTVKILCIAFLLLAGTSLPGAEITQINKLDQAALTNRLAEDARTVLLHRDGLRKVIAYVESRTDLFPAETPKTSGLLRREQKEVVWETWQRLLDYLLALDSLEQYHKNFYRLKGPAKADSFLIGYAATLAQYRAVLEFIARADRSPGLDKVLNDPVPEIGLPANSYAKLRLKYLNVAMATDFAARQIILKTFGKEGQPLLRDAISADASYLWKTGRGTGEAMTAKNALKIIQRGADAAWLPVQTGVAEWMGQTKVRRSGQFLITEEQIKALQSQLLPGDVFLERREWYMSNIGLPGFWSHAAIYIGTSAERRAFFADPDVQAWVKQHGEATGDFEALLRARFPQAWERSQICKMDNRIVQIVEAIGPGVSFTSLAHSAICDSLAVLRPKLSKTEKAQALYRAFHYAGRPYDYNFDFATDAELVCTELVYKSYEPATGMKGLKFPLVEMLGRKVTPANELAKQFDAQYGTADEQFELVAFLDGVERKGEAVKASVTEFRQTWKRPKWHVLVQEEQASTTSN